MRIGILEDNQASGRVLQLSLELAEHTVYNTETINDFLALMLSPVAVDLLLVDFLLLSARSEVGLSGADVIRFIRKTSPSLPAIVISAAPLPRLQRSLEGLSRVKILQKPFRVAMLLEMIEEIRSEQIKKDGEWQR